MTTHELRRQLGMSQKQFSAHYGVPLSTIRNWDSRGCMPDYIANMLTEIVVLQSRYEYLSAKYEDALFLV